MPRWIPSLVSVNRPQVGLEGRPLGVGLPAEVAGVPDPAVDSVNMRLQVLPPLELPPTNFAPMPDTQVDDVNVPLEVDLLLELFLAKGAPVCSNAQVDRLCVLPEVPDVVVGLPAT